MAVDSQGERTLPEPTAWQWSIKEYEILSAHYFHEDKLLYEAVTVFGSINGALLAFVSSTLASENVFSRVYVPAIGIVLCITWLICLVRIEHFRTLQEKRIEEVENALVAAWPLSGTEAPKLRRNHSSASGSFPAKIPVSTAFRTIPIAFGVIWIATPINFFWPIS